jgi:glyoxylase-like metal-dependent hydrolase (beta-lactamase superfamily II)
VVPVGSIALVAGGAVGPLVTDEWDCNVWLLQGSRRSILIDAGAGRTPLQLPADTDAVLVTHLHVDHSAGAAALARQGLRVLAHPWTAEGLRTADEERAGLTISQERGFYPRDLRLEPCAADDLEPGSRLDLGGVTVTAVDTPGHADGHLAFLAEDVSGRRTLFSGDLVFPDGHVFLQPLPDCRLDALWDSLVRVAALEPDALHAGHCAAVERGAGEHLAMALEAFACGGIPTQLPA